MKNETIQRLAIPLTIFVLSSIALAYANFPFSHDTDDAYITYRYAENIANGHGFVYNEGERVLGTTTPLYTLLLALPALAGADTTRVSLTYNIIFGALALLFIYLLLYRSTGSVTLGMAGVLLCFTSTEFLLFAIQGMETPLYLCLIIAAFYFYDSGRLSVAAALAGFCFLTRFDGIALPFALIIHFVFTKRSLPPPRSILVFAGVVLPWILFSYIYFGDIRPQSMLAKHHHALVANRYWMISFLKSHGHQFLLVPAVVGFLLHLSDRGEPRKPGVEALFLWFVCYVAAYTLYRIDLYRWYLSPVTMPLAIMPVFGLSILLRTMMKLWTDSNRIHESGNYVKVRAVFLMVLVIPAVLVYARRERTELSYGVYWNDTVESTRLDVAEYLNQQGKPDQIVLTGAIGIIGYFTRMWIWDSMSLVTKNSPGTAFEEMIHNSNADWIITEPSPGTAPQPNIMNYRLVGLFRRDPSLFNLALYQKSNSQVLPRPNIERTDIEFASKFVISRLAVTPQNISITLRATERISVNYKFLVHLYDLSDSKFIRAEDFYPVISTSAMEVGQEYETVNVWSIELPTEGATIHIGLFDESLPDFPAIPLMSGDKHLIVPYRPVDSQ